MNLKKIIKEEMDDFDWVRETKPLLKSVEDIKYFLNKPFKLYDAKTGEVEATTTSVAIDGIFWMEEYEKSPTRYKVCWDELITRQIRNTYLGYNKKKNCVTYSSEDIVKNFNEPYDWLWKFIG